MAAERAGSVNWKLSLGGGPVDAQDIVQFTVDKDLNQPDMAVAVLRNSDHKYVAQAKIGDPFKIETTEPGKDTLKILFVGEISGIEPVYKGGAESRVTVRAFCKLHKKLAGRRSKTFQDKTDQQILNEVLGGVEDFQGPDEKPCYKHITQDNMSDLDFARLRASRMGCFIWSENGSIKVKKPKFEDSGIEFYVYENQGRDHRMKSFAPRLTGAQIVRSLEVRGWDPEKKEAIVQRVQAAPSPLGNTEASAASGSKAADVTFTCDEPIFSSEEARMVAKAKLQDHNLGYMSAEAEAFGNPEYMPGTVIKISINSQAADKFDGKYFVTGTTHKYAHGTPTNPDGGYTTVFRLARNAEVQ
jgi:phage protein D